jgi:hypothetical protein
VFKWLANRLRKEGLVSRSDLDAAIDNLTSSVGALGAQIDKEVTDVTAAVQDLQTKVAAGSTDFSAELKKLNDATANLQSAGASLKNLDAAVKAADPGPAATPAATPPATPNP